MCDSVWFRVCVAGLMLGPRAGVGPSGRDIVDLCFDCFFSLLGIIYLLVEGMIVCGFVFRKCDPSLYLQS